MIHILSGNDAARYPALMEQVHRLSVPLLVEIGVGPNWRDLT